jgi:hypothetical protein
VAPGLALLARFAGHLFTYCLIGTASWRLLSLCGISISSWWLVPGLIASLPLGITFKNLAHNYEAAALGARPMPVLQGKMFGNIDLMLRLVEAMRTGYPGDGMIGAIAVVGNCFNFRVMFDDILFTCEPRHIKAVLAADFENFVKGDRFKNLMFNVLGTGVFNSDANMWKFHRGITRPFFTHERISHFNIFDRHAEDAITQIKSRLRAGYPVDSQVCLCACISLPRDEPRIFRMLFHVSPLILQPSFSSGNVHTVSLPVLLIPTTWLRSGTRLVIPRSQTTLPMQSQMLNT